jgi:hypothetical protein
VSYSVRGNGTIKTAPSSPDRKHPGYKPPDSSVGSMLQFDNLKSQISNRLTESIQDTSPRIHPWGQCFNSIISNRLTESIQDTSPRIHSESRLRTGEIKNLYPMKLAPRIYPWGQCFNLQSQISNLKSIDDAQGSSVSTTSPQTAAAWPGFLTTQKQVTITLRLMNIIKKSQVTGTKE